MNDRLTKKYEDNSGYTPVVNHPVRKEITLFDFEEQDYDCCVEKLGGIEDLMEEYNINSVEELKEIIHKGLAIIQFLESEWKKGKK